MNADANAPIYCSKCQKVTETTEAHRKESKTKRLMLRGHCAVCNTYKSSFVKSDPRPKEEV